MRRRPLVPNQLDHGPPPSWPGEKDKYTSGRPFSALTRILPYLEQRSLYSSINFEVQKSTNPNSPLYSDQYQYPENMSASKTTLAVFLCPSDDPSQPTAFGCNYRGNHGVGPQPCTTYEDAGQWERILHRRHGPRAVVVSPMASRIRWRTASGFEARASGRGSSRIADFGEIRVAAFLRRARRGLCPDVRPVGGEPRLSRLPRRRLHLVPRRLRMHRL